MEKKIRRKLRKVSKGSLNNRIRFRARKASHLKISFVIEIKCPSLFSLSSAFKVQKALKVFPYLSRIISATSYAK